MEWRDFEGKTFITDIRAALSAQADETRQQVGPYAVWVPEGQRHRVVETGFDLNSLREKYGVPADMLLTARENGDGGNYGI